MDNQNEVIFNIQQKLKQWIYYLIVFGLSMCIMIVFPMLGVGNDAPSLNLPSTTAGWIEYIAVRAAISTINLFIYICFVQQGKLNVVNHPNYIQANELLDKVKIKEIKPRSPAKFKAKQYGGKSIGIFTSSAFALVAFPPIIAYDWQVAIMYLLTIVMAIFFGLYQMKVTEVYWSEEYLEYAKWIVKEENESLSESNIKEE